MADATSRRRIAKTILRVAGSAVLSLLIAVAAVMWLMSGLVGGAG